MKIKIVRFIIAATSAIILSGLRFVSCQVKDDSVKISLEREKECHDKGLEKVRMTYLRIVKLKLEYHDKVLLQNLESLRLELRSIKDYCQDTFVVRIIDKDIDKALSGYFERQAEENKNVSSPQQSKSEDKHTLNSGGTAETRLEEECRIKVNNDIQNRNYESAVLNCNKLIDLVPDYAEYYWTRASLYYELKNYPFAIKDYSSFIRYLPEDSLDRLATAYFNRANCKTLLSDHYGALDDLGKALGIKPGSSHIYNQIAWERFLMKDYNEALKNADKAVQCDPSDYNAVDTRATIRLNMGDNKGCLEDCEKVLRMKAYPNTYLIKGRALYRLGDKENACKSWSKAGELGITEAYDYITKYCK